MPGPTGGFSPSSSYAEAERKRLEEEERKKEEERQRQEQAARENAGSAGLPFVSQKGTAGAQGLTNNTGVNPNKFVKDAVVKPDLPPVTRGATPNWEGRYQEGATKGLTDLRDQFLNERHNVSPYPVGPVGTQNTPVIALDRSGIDSDRGMALSNIGTLRDVSEGRGLATTPTEIEEARTMSLSHLKNLQDIASGKVPGVGDAQRAAAMAEAQQTAIGLAASGAAAGGGAGALRAGLRSINEAGRRVGVDTALIAAKEAADARAGIGAGIENLRSADQAFGLARAAEQIGARNQIGSQIENLRGADQGLAVSEAGRLQGVATSDVDRMLKADTTSAQLGLDAYKTSVEEKAGLGKLGLESEQTASQTRLNEAKIQDMKDQLKFLYEKLRTETNVEERKQTFALIGSILGALGGVGAAAAGGA